MYLTTLGMLLTTFSLRSPSRLRSSSQEKVRRLHISEDLDLDPLQHGALQALTSVSTENSGAFEAATPANPGQKGITWLLEKNAAPGAP